MVPYLQIDGLTKSFGDLVLFNQISLGVAEGQRIGLIAKNGSGKTTLLNIIAGKEGYDEGSIVFRRDLCVGYLEQDPHYPEELTVLEACFHHGNTTVQLIKEYERCMETEGNPGMEDLLARMEHEKAWDYERRFQPITVEEPDEKQCEKILKGLRERYETHHHVQITDEALQAAVTLSARYISDRFLPDKAIDVIDEACAKVSLSGFKTPEHIYELEKVLGNYEAKMEEAILAGDLVEASRIRAEKEDAQKKIMQTKKRFQKKQAGRKPLVTEEEVAAVVSDWTKIPVQKLQESEGARLQKLEQTLHKRVVGQEEAVTAVAKAVRRGRVGLKDPKRPIGSFLFLGPTGVGKTELSKALSEALFHDENAMIRVDMSEYMEQHSVAKMIGSTPVGVLSVEL